MGVLQVEVEVILAAHRLYTEAGCLEGIDSLVNLTTLSVLRWASQHEFKALASLAAGMTQNWHCVVTRLLVGVLSEKTCIEARGLPF